MNVEKVLCGGGRLQPGRGGRTRAGNRRKRQSAAHLLLNVDSRFNIYVCMKAEGGPCLVWVWNRTC